jgi:hypothetical protein
MILLRMHNNNKFHFWKSEHLLLYMCKFGLDLTVLILETDIDKVGLFFYFIKLIIGCW